MPSQNEIRQTITSTIVETSEERSVACRGDGRGPWTKTLETRPTSSASGQYRGINPLILGVASIRHNLRSKWWATFNQWKELGRLRHEASRRRAAGEMGYVHHLLAEADKDRPGRRR